MNYTDTQLKQALAKMLPDGEFSLSPRGYLISHFETDRPVLDTELLHLCWLVEEIFDQKDCNAYNRELLDYQDGNTLGWRFHASWQQRVIALSKVKGVEIL